MPTSKSSVMAHGNQLPATSLPAPFGSTAAHLVRPLTWLRSIFAQRLVFRRSGMNVSIGFEAPAEPSGSTKSPAAASRRGEALRRDHETLRAWLDRHADSRQALRHLAYVEQALARKGTRALRDTPPRVLREALAQLQSLAGDDARTAFPELAQRLGQAAARPGRLREQADAALHVDVSEASISLFVEMERGWSGRMPLDAHAPAAEKGAAAAR